MDTLTHRDARWSELGLDNLQNQWEMSFFNQEDDGPDQLKGEWFATDEDFRLPDGSAVIFGGTFGNYNSPGASDYTQAEVYGPDELDAFAERVKELDGFPEYLESDDEEPEPEDDEPGEDDYTTRDHREFYQSGKLVVSVTQEEYDRDTEAGLRALAAFMEREKDWSGVWFISDHGNTVSIDMSEYL